MSAAQTLARWLDDPDTWIGVFENHDLGHYNVGQRCAFPFPLSDGSYDAAVVGSTRAPDGKTIGLGWRYVLIAKCRTATDAFAALQGRDQ